MNINCVVRADWTFLLNTALGSAIGLLVGAILYDVGYDWIKKRRTAKASK